MSIGGLPPGLRRVPRLMGGAVAGRGSFVNDPGAAADPSQPALPAAPQMYSYLVVAGPASKQAIPDNPRRCYLLVQNNGDNVVYLGFGAKAEPNGIRLKPDFSFEPAVTPGSSIHVVTDSGETNVVFLEGV